MRHDVNVKQVGSLFFGFTYEFLERYLPLQIGRSPETVRAYRDALTVFRRYVSEEASMSIKTFTFEQCSRDYVLGFIESLKARGCSAGTCNQRIAALKSYLWFAADKDVALQSVALSVSRIPPQKGAKKVRVALPEEALGAILQQPDPHRKIGVRDLTILVVLYDCAIRLSELIDLTLGDLYIDVAEPHIYVIGKGSKERVVAMTDLTAAHVKNFIAAYHPGADVSKKDTPLFYTRIKGVQDKMSSSNVERIVQKYADMARETCDLVPKKVYPHMMRRTRATNLLQAGVPIESVSRILGHSNTSTTRIYATPSITQLREVMNSTMGIDQREIPEWSGDEEELIRLCGLR